MLSAPEIIIMLLLLAQMGALVVAGMKGRWVWFVLGLFLWLPAFVGALLPAMPGSAWEARRRSGQPRL